MMMISARLTPISSMNSSWRRTVKTVLSRRGVARAHGFEPRRQFGHDAGALGVAVAGPACDLVEAPAAAPAKTGHGINHTDLFAGRFHGCHAGPSSDASK